MQRRDFLKIGAGALALATTTRAQTAPAKRPNILFVFADDMKADCLGALGNPRIRTPNLDRLVRRGFAFSHAYTFGSMVGAVCLPSRSMLLTGRSLFHLPAEKVLRGKLPQFEKALAGQQEGRDWVLLPRVLRAAGYETFHVGKSGNGFVPGLQAFEHNTIRDDRPVAERTTSSQNHANQVIEFLRTRTGDRPFFIYVAPPVPHDPRVAPQEFMDLYDPAKIPLPVNFQPVHPFDNGDMAVRDEQLAPWPRTPEIVRRHLADYYACVTCLDHHVGRIIAHLEQAKLLDNTIVVFSGDNGLSLGDHGLFGKQNVYEYGGMHVPLVLAGPGIPAGRSDALVYLLDLFPTICNLAGTPIPAPLEGQSLVPVMMGRSAAVREYLFTAYKPQRAIRTDRWKLIRYTHINKTQLFDLQTDPREMDNLAEKPEHAGKIREMMALLEKAQKQWDDTCPLVSPTPAPAQWIPPART
ncbi:MAG: sulfatase-like hydrolase/transferase [Planctomycetes bacterium]|jgi:arylsulfatase A-like enzyme|nr:sulfatase-like hydrolase/transferase [Planctomycetota bacterium]